MDTKLWQQITAKNIFPEKVTYFKTPDLQLIIISPKKFICISHKRNQSPKPSSNINIITKLRNKISKRYKSPFKQTTQLKCLRDLTPNSIVKIAADWTNNCLV